MVYILRLWLIMKDLLNRSVLHTEVLHVLIDLKCLQLVFLGGRRLARLWSLLCNISLKRSYDSFYLLS